MNAPAGLQGGEKVALIGTIRRRRCSYYAAAALHPLTLSC